MNILFVSALFPFPLHSGGQVRIYNLLKELGKKHKITLFSFIRDTREQDYTSHLPFCQTVHTVMRGRAWQPGYILRSVFGKYPLLLTTYDNSTMRQAIADELQKNTYDLIHLEPSYVWPSSPKTDKPVVVTEHNIEHGIYEGYVRGFGFVPLRPFLYADVLKLKQWEKIIWQKADHIVAVSQKDQEEIVRACGGKDVWVVPNGVDTQRFTFHPQKEIPKDSGPICLFVGYFGWLQNRDALSYLLDNLWPSIIKAFPNAKLWVIGKGLPRPLRYKLQVQSGILREDVDDIVSQYHAAHVLLAPIRIGGGTKYKILEAMAAGVPVVTTTIGASGLDIANEKEVFIADNADQTVQSIRIACADSKMREAIVKRARLTIEKNYSWVHIAKKLEAVWSLAYEKKS